LAIWIEKDEKFKNRFEIFHPDCPFTQKRMKSLAPYRRFYIPKNISREIRYFLKIWRYNNSRQFIRSVQFIN